MIPTTTNLAVRIATDNDLAAVIELVQYAYRGGKQNTSWTGEEHLVKGPRITPDKLAEILTLPDNAVLICELVNSGEPAKIVGSIHISKQDDSPDCAHIGMLAVDPDWQSGGVGSRLMRSAEEFARQKLRVVQMVGEVISGRPELMDWYARMGYLPTGKTAPFLGPEHGVEPLVKDLHFVLIAKKIAE